MFHFLVLPRIRDDSDTSLLDNLHSLLNGDKQRASDILLDLREDVKNLRQEIEEEMMSRYGFKWDIWAGFHGTPSMEHLHLHVLSADLCSDRLKNKKHYNSFHPKLGFFLHLDDVFSWFEQEPSLYSSKARGLIPSTFEPLLKEDLSCFHCGCRMKNMPSLKVHLQTEWEKLEKASKR
ncbi:hypothetical protein BDQ17DRAFT_1353434 [Cyathus striatus]|nr:hypothetical protein BDQ17DRAFT_1353434 [Cyathus striatus]